MVEQVTHKLALNRLVKIKLILSTIQEKIKRGKRNYLISNTFIVLLPSELENWMKYIPADRCPAFQTTEWYPAGLISLISCSTWAPFILYTFTSTWAIAGKEKSNLTFGLKGLGYGADIVNLSGISLFN